MGNKLHPCCDTTSPSPIWEGIPAGKIVNIDGIEAYVANSNNTTRNNTVSIGEESAQKRVILFLTEAHSIYFMNAQLLADAFASRLNCDVIMPDQFGGDRRVPAGYVPHFLEEKALVDDRSESTTESDNSILPPHYQAETDDEFEVWKQNHGPSVTDPVLERILQHIHTTYGENVKIGGVGYCFGGRYVMRLMGAGAIDVGVVNHPSFFTLSEIAKLGTGKRLAIYAAETDDILPAPKRRAMEDELTVNGSTWMSTVFSGTEHGFAVRGDLSITEVRLAKERAFLGAVEWFGAWL